MNLHMRPTGEDTVTEGQMRHEFHSDQVAYTIQQTKYTSDFWLGSTEDAEGTRYLLEEASFQRTWLLSPS
jgi:hypothetical protein